MTIYALINKEVLPFVCEGKKVTKGCIQTSTGLKAEKIDKWFDINNPTLPTVLQAKKLAKCLRIPFAGLYMNTSDIKIKAIPSIKNYRTFDARLSIDDSSLNLAIGDVLRERDFLIEESTELGMALSAFSAPLCKNEEPSSWARMIREYFSIDITDQYKCSSPRRFYLYLREKMERKGVFVQCFTGVPIEIARGFSIYEQQLPIIGINDEDRPPAKSFTMIHELVHILKRESTLCNIMYDNISSKREETFCNAVAGELLVPKESLIEVLNNARYKEPYETQEINALAKKFSVSKEVIIRRLLDCDQIDSLEYETYTNEFRRELEKDKEEQRLARKAGLSAGIPRNISRETIDRTSPSVCKTLYYGFSEEKYSKRDIALHLRIAQKHVDKFLQEVSTWNN